jgi:hypothetical protein
MAANSSSSSSSASNTTSPDPIMQMATGFWASKTLMAAVELEVFTKLSGKAVTLSQFQNLLEIEFRPAEVLSTALVALGLLKASSSDTNRNADGQRIFSNSDISDRFLDKNKPSSYMGDFITMLDKQMYNRWGNIVQSLKTNRPVEATTDANISVGSMFDEAKSNQAIQQMQMFTRAMYGVSVGPAMALAKVFDFSNYKKMMDIGGGSGVYPIEVVKQNPNMSAVMLDLGPACRVADQYIKQFNLQDKIHTQVMDFFKDDLPKDCDVAFLSHIVHLLDKEKNKILLKKVYDSLSDDNGVVMVSEWLLNDQMTGPIPASLLSLTILVEQPEGRNYSYNEISKILTDVGFNNIEKRPLVGPVDIVIGYKNKREK